MVGWLEMGFRFHIQIIASIFSYASPEVLKRREGRWVLNQDCHDGGMMGVIPSRTSPPSLDSRLDSRGNDVMGLYCHSEFSEESLGAGV